ncbi:NlpC/P60 family protein [Spirillospora sp. CA-128828]|uniref:C40 family peptidase n=1 Tax=Spirillospora sp. CA-128828 TaxID=3240033 RepID=UPI003D900A66
MMSVVAVLGVLVHASTARAVPCAGDASGGAPSQPGASKSAENSIPVNYLNHYRKAGQRYGVPWNVLAGIGKEESDHGRGDGPGIHSGQNYAGAQGPMQFLRSTWDAHGIDGDGNGTKDVYNPADAIFGAANYLKHNHADKGGKQLYNAIFAYNHAHWYVKNVLRDADQYAKGGFTISGSNTAGTSCIPTGQSGPSVNGPFGARVVAYARKWARTDPPTPYVWGQGNTHGPTHGCGHGFCGTGFDCSGLTQYAIYQASGGKITIPHYTFDQLDDDRGEKVSWSQLQPGDLIFLSDGDHVVIFAGNETIIEAPFTGSHVRVAPLRSKGFIGARRFGKGIP